MRAKLEKFEYDPSLEIVSEDRFGPITKPYEDFLTLPKSVKIHFIDSESNVHILDKLLDEKYIGVDSEWRPKLTKFHRTYPALL